MRIERTFRTIRTLTTFRTFDIMEKETEKIQRKVLKGKVISVKMAKTVVVQVDRFIKHKRYGKYVKRSKNFKAHDEKNEYKVGDTVLIESIRPISKDKHFLVKGRI